MMRLASVGCLLALATTASAQQRQLLIEDSFDSRLIGGGVAKPGPFGGPAFGQQIALQGQPPGGRIILPPNGGPGGNPVPEGRPRSIRPPAPSPSIAPKADLHGDMMPAGALARYGTIRLRHGTEPIALVFSPDGKQLASVSATDDGLRLWDIATGKEMARYDQRVSVAAITSDGQVIVADGDKCKVWTPGMKTIRDLPDGSLPEGTNTLAVAPDNRTFAAGCMKKIALIDLQTGKLKAELKLPVEQPPLRLVFSPDGRWLAASGQNKLGVWLWDLKTNKRVRTYPAMADYAEFSFSADGNRLAIGGEQLRIVLTDSEEIIEGFRPPPEGQFFAVRFSSDGKLVYALQQDGTVLQVNAETGEIKDSWSPPDISLRNPIVLAPGAHHVAGVDPTGGIRIWDPQTGKGPEAERLSALTDPGFSADGKTASVIDQQGRIHTFDLTTGKLDKMIELPVEDPLPSTYDARSGRATVLTGSEPFEVQVLEVSTKKVLAKFSASNNGLPSIAFSQADRDRVAVFVPGSVAIHSLRTGKPIRTIDVGHADDVNPRGCFSPDGRLLAVTTRPLSVWELSTGKKRFDIDGVNDPVGTVFSDDGRYLATWDFGEMVVIIDVRTGASVRRFRIPSADSSVTVALFTPDGKRLVTGGVDGLITIWDVATGEPVLNLDRHDGVVTGLAFSPDGKRMLSSATDGTVLVWDLAVKIQPREVVAIAGLDEAYRLLGSGDPAQAARGQEYLYRHSADGVKMLSEKITIPSATPPERIAKLVTELGSEDYQTRRGAMTGLVMVGGEASDAVRQAAEKSPSAEVRKLADEILTKFDATPVKEDELRTLRAVEVLENLARTEPADAEARDLLKKWSAGPKGHRMTVESAAALARLNPVKP